MSNLRRSFLFILAAIVLIIAYGCKKDDSNPTASGDDLVGTWVLTKVIVITPQGKVNYTPQQAGITMTVTLRSDKTYQQTQTTNGQTTNESGTWSVSNGSIIANATTGTTMTLPYRVNGNILQLDSTTTDPSTGAVLPMTLEYTKQ